MSESQPGGAQGRGTDAFEEHERLQRRLDRSVIAGPLLESVPRESRDAAEARADTTPPVPIVIDLNLDYVGGRDGAAQRVHQLIESVVAEVGSPAVDQGSVDESRPGGQYVITTLQPHVIQHLVARDAEPENPREQAIFHVWPDFPVQALLDRSTSTVKADAARVSFAAGGRDIVWAVLDSGVDVSHPHFQAHGNTVLEPPLAHLDFTGEGGETVDAYGHGTHVAGIIAGHAASTDAPLNAVRRKLDASGNATYSPLTVKQLSGIAPECRIVSYKVLDDRGNGSSSAILRAIDQVQQINNYGRTLKIHGVNLSVGYEFDPEWFACGQSPLCIEVDRLVRSGVVVVVAAGNTGYAYAVDAGKRTQLAAGRPLTINDPGNAQHAITVGSTHRDMPHTYGVSYFSSKGPTGDGRAKPDLVAPGEKILSAATGAFRERATSQGIAAADYIENSGTSMAAPHVSGVIAAFLSVRQEFLGRPDEVKRIFTSTATDLGRTRDFQGWGLVDLMRAIQSV